MHKVSWKLNLAAFFISYIYLFEVDLTEFMHFCSKRLVYEKQFFKIIDENLE